MDSTWLRESNTLWCGLGFTAHSVYLDLFLSHEIGRESRDGAEMGNQDLERYRRAEKTEGRREWIHTSACFCIKAHGVCAALENDSVAMKAWTRVWSCFISSLCYSSPVWAWALLAAPELHVPFCKTRMIKSPSCLCSYWSAAPSPACSHGSHDMAAICVFESLCVITIDSSRRFELIGTAATWKTALKNCQGSLYFLYW